MAKTLIFDFDGVLADTMPILAGFLYYKLPFSRRNCFARVHNAALKNSRSRFPYLRRFGGNIYYSYILSQIQKGNLDLDKIRNLELLEIVKQLPGKKILLTSNYTNVCNLTLGDYSSMFEQILTYDQYRSKTQAIANLTSKTGLKLEDCVFITDTYGDVEELLRLTSRELIYAVDWGYHPRSLLQTLLPKEQVLNEFEQITKIPLGN